MGSCLSSCEKHEEKQEVKSRSKEESVTNHQLRQLMNSTYDSVPIGLIRKTVLAKVVDIYDGDTITVAFYNKGELEKYTIRVLGYDSPEIKPKKDSKHRDEEIHKAYLARNRMVELVTDCKVKQGSKMTRKELRKLLNGNTRLITVEFVKFDKYGGRMLGNINTEEDDSISEIMIKEGYGYSYSGGKKKKFGDDSESD